MCSSSCARVCYFAREMLIHPQRRKFVPPPKPTAHFLQSTQVLRAHLHSLSSLHRQSPPSTFLRFAQVYNTSTPTGPRRESPSHETPPYIHFVQCIHVHHGNTTQALTPCSHADITPAHHRLTRTPRHAPPRGGPRTPSHTTPAHRHSHGEARPRGAGTPSRTTPPRGHSRLEARKPPSQGDKGTNRCGGGLNLSGS